MSQNGGTVLNQITVATSSKAISKTIFQVNIEPKLIKMEREIEKNF